MNTINFIIQSVDGIGKTYVATKIHEYFKSKNIDLNRYSSNENINSNISEVQKIELIASSNEISPSALNQIIDTNTSSKTNTLIDTEAKDFIPISQYIGLNIAQELLVKNDITAYLHIVIVGDRHQDETLNGLLNVFKIVPENVKIIVWLNEYFGAINADGKTFEELKLYKNNCDKIHKINVLDSEISDKNLGNNHSNLSEQLDTIFGLENVVIQNTQIEKIIENIAPNILQKLIDKLPHINTENLTEEVIAQYTEKLNIAFEKHLNSLAAANALNLSEASNKAELITTQAAQYITNHMREAADEIYASTSKMLAAQIAEANKAAIEAKNARNFTIAFSIIALALVACALIWLFN